METGVDFNLYTWLTSRSEKAISILGGSATPSLSLDDIVSLSNDPEATKAAFDYNNIPLGLASAQGGLQLREVLASTYDTKLSGITAGKIIVANGATGANHIVQSALLQSGDHVIAQYPIYGPLIQEPRLIGCNISYLRLDPSNSWQIDIDELQSLIKPGITKMLILNNPNNPTGTYMETDTQRRIIDVAQKHNLIIHCDEIFRPLFHTDQPLPTSMIEHMDTFPQYDRIITTSSLSKVYGLSGVRIGWITTRSPELFQKFMHMRLYTVQAASMIDELVATEVLGPRCRPGILAKHAALARRNLDLIQGFVDRNSTVCEWVRPTAGAVAFVKFRHPKSGEEVDDVTFSQKLVDSKKVVLSPASLCFEFPQNGSPSQEFKGRVRLHFTTDTENLRRGLSLMEEFLKEEQDSA